MSHEENASQDDFTVIQLTDVLDLHSVPPRDVKGVVEAYLDEARLRGWTALRIIHGKGIGRQREIVRGILGKSPFVKAFGDAPMEAGGWGSTVVTLIPGPRIEVVRAEPDEQPILANLLELYAHDFSEFKELQLHDDGRFGYPHLPLYWREPDRHPFLIRVDGNLAGLALVKRDSANWDMAEFFIVRGYRKQGIGSHAARRVWEQFSGDWQVRVLEANSAKHFWEYAIAAFVGNPVKPDALEKDGRAWRVFSFPVHPAA